MDKWLLGTSVYFKVFLCLKTVSHLDVLCCELICSCRPDNLLALEPVEIPTSFSLSAHWVSVSVLLSNIFFTYSPCSFSVPVSPPGSSHVPLLLPSLGSWKRWALPLWIKRSCSVPSTKAPCTAALQCALWSLASPTGATMTTSASHCPWTSMTCSTSET